MDILVSVLMTAYNREKTIVEAIESVLASSYKSFELIIVDDCSSDKTLAIAKKYEQQDSRVRVYVNEQNLGDYFNRNKAASYASGKYLKYLDADDFIYSYALAVMVNALEDNPSAAMAVPYIPEATVSDNYQPYPILVEPSWVARTHLLKKSVLSAGPSAVIIRKDIFNEFNGFTGLRYIGDLELWMMIAFKYPVVLIPPFLIWWRTHEGQEVEKEKYDDKALVRRYELHRTFIEMESLPLNKSERALALKKLNRRHIVNITKIFLRGDGLRRVFRILKQTNMSVKEFVNAVFH